MAQKNAKLSDDAAAQLIERRVDIRGESSERQPFDRMMLRNRAFFFGKQNFVEDARTGRLRDPASLPPGRVLYKANLIKGDVMRAMLTVAGATGEFVVPPKSNLRKDRHSAWVSTKLFEHISRLLRMPEKEQVATLFAAIDGSVMWKPTWDPDKGEAERFYWGDATGRIFLRDADPRTKAQLEDEGRYTDKAPGDVGLSVVSMLNMDWDWRAREGGIDECRWIAEKHAVSMEFIEEGWPDQVHLVRPDESLQGALYYNEAISFMASNYAPLGTYRSRQDNHEKQVILVEYWERPTALNGNVGRKIVWAGGHVLENRDNPYRLTGFPLPYVKQDWVKAPGRFLGLSLVEDLTSLQRQHNRAAAKIIEHGDVFGSPAIFVPNDSGIPVGQYSVQPGCVYGYKPTGGKIEHGPTPNLPKEVADVVNLTRAAMAEISSQQSLDGSKLPGQLRSGPALETVFEERNKMLGHPATQRLIAMALVGQRLLAIAHKRYPAERVIKYVGDDKKFRVLAFSMADVQTDLQVIIDPSKMLASPSALRARITEYVQAGVVDPINRPEDREAVFKALEFGGVDELISDRLQEEENQEREIVEINADPEKWAAGQPDIMAPAEEDPMSGQPLAPGPVQGYPINVFDDHSAHVRVLLRYLRSEEFRALDDLRKSLHLAHFGLHQQALDEAMMKQLAMMEATQGSPGQKGKPSAPKPQVA